MKTQHDLEEKRLLALHRERRQLWRNGGQKVALEHPIQKGWMRCYFLTEAAEQRPDASTLREILREINVVQYHCRRDFVPTRRRQRVKMEQFHQPLQRIRPWRRESAGLPEPWKPYFVSEPVFVGWRWLSEWRFLQTDLVELRVVPRILYELPVCDPEVESREAEIEAILVDPKRRCRLNKLLGSRRWSLSRDRQKELDDLAWKRVRAVLEGDVENVEAEKTAATLPSFPPQHFQCFRSSIERALWF